MCLCGMLAAEYETLPDPMRRAVVRFFDTNEAWLAKVLARGRRRRTLAFAGRAREAARLIVSGLEGAMLVARPYGDLARFRPRPTGFSRASAQAWCGCAEPLTPALSIAGTVIVLCSTNCGHAEPAGTAGG